MRWTTFELTYLANHAGEGAKAIAKALGRSTDSVEWQARQCGVSLRRRSQCPLCGQWSFKPLNRVTGWCAECTKERRMSELAEIARAMKEEAIREKRNNQERQRYYSAKSRNKKIATEKTTAKVNCENGRKEE